MQITSVEGAVEGQGHGQGRPPCAVPWLAISACNQCCTDHHRTTNHRAACDGLVQQEKRPSRSMHWLQRGKGLRIRGGDHAQRAERQGIQRRRRKTRAYQRPRAGNVVKTGRCKRAARDDVGEEDDADAVPIMRAEFRTSTSCFFRSTAQCRRQTAALTSAAPDGIGSWKLRRARGGRVVEMIAATAKTAEPVSAKDAPPEPGVGRYSGAPSKRIAVWLLWRPVSEHEARTVSQPAQERQATAHAALQFAERPPRRRRLLASYAAPRGRPSSNAECENCLQKRRQTRREWLAADVLERTKSTGYCHRLRRR